MLLLTDSVARGSVMVYHCCISVWGYAALWHNRPYQYPFVWDSVSPDRWHPTSHKRACDSVTVRGRIIRSFLFQTPGRLRVRAARCLTVTMTAWTRMGRRRDNEDRELTSLPSNCRSWRLCLPGTDIQTCQPGRKYPCGPTWRSPESG